MAITNIVSISANYFKLKRYTYEVVLDVQASPMRRCKHEIIAHPPIEAPDLSAQGVLS